MYFIIMDYFMGKFNSGYILKKRYKYEQKQLIYTLDIYKDAHVWIMLTQNQLS